MYIYGYMYVEYCLYIYILYMHKYTVGISVYRYMVSVSVSGSVPVPVSAGYIPTGQQRGKTKNQTPSEYLTIPISSRVDYIPTVKYLLYLT